MQQATVSKRKNALQSNVWLPWLCFCTGPSVSAWKESTVDGTFLALPMLLQPPPSSRVAPWCSTHVLHPTPSLSRSVLCQICLTCRNTRLTGRKSRSSSSRCQQSRSGRVWLSPRAGWGGQSRTARWGFCHPGQLPLQQVRAPSLQSGAVWTDTPPSGRSSPPWKTCCYSAPGQKRTDQSDGREIYWNLNRALGIFYF